MTVAFVDVIPLVSTYSSSTGENRAVSGNVLFADGDLISATFTNDCPSGVPTCYMTGIGQSSFVYTQTLDHVTIDKYGDYLLFSNAEFNNNRGAVIIIDLGKLHESEFDLTDSPPALDDDATKAFRMGENDNSHLGKAQFLDFDGNGVPEIVAHTSSPDYGSIVLLNFKTLDDGLVFQGYDSLRLNTALFVAGDFDGINGQDLIFGTSDTLTSDGTILEEASSIAGIASSAITGSSASLVNNLDWSVETADAAINYMATGDLNGDGFNDLVLADADTGDLLISFGTSDLGVSTTTLTLDTAIASANLPLLNLLVGDVTDDGFADIIASYDDGEEQLSVFLGNELFSEFPPTLDDPVIWAGMPGEIIVVGDSDGDGVTETYGSTAPGNSMLILSTDIAVDDATVAATPDVYSASHADSGGGSCQLSVVARSHRSGFVTAVCFFFLALLPLTLTRRRAYVKIK